MNIMFKDSVEPGNKYSFHCSTVNRPARFLVCAFMRNMHWRGDVIPNKDCRVAMIGGKCPAVRMMAKEQHEGVNRDVPRQFFDKDDTTVHKIPSDIQEHLDRILLIPYHARGIDLTDEQQVQLFGRTIDQTLTNILIPAPIVSKKSRSVATEVNNESRYIGSSERQSGSTVNMMAGLDHSSPSAAEIINEVIEGDDQDD